MLLLSILKGSTGNVKNRLLFGLGLGIIDNIDANYTGTDVQKERIEK